MACAMKWVHILFCYFTVLPCCCSEYAIFFELAKGAPFLGGQTRKGSAFCGRQSLSAGQKCLWVECEAGFQASLQSRLWSGNLCAIYIQHPSWRPACRPVVLWMLCLLSQSVTGHMKYCSRFLRQSPVEVGFDPPASASQVL